MTAVPLSIWTIGHSTRTIEDFLNLLSDYQIQNLIDVRRFPGSRRFPQFNQPQLKLSLSESNINYEHLAELGGRRRPQHGSHNLCWRNASFRGYADYMETQPFSDGVAHLLGIAHVGRTVIMCSEAVWWRCHRSMIADDLKARGIMVFHILDRHKVQLHPYTSVARVVDGRLSYKCAPPAPEQLSGD